MSFLLLRRSIRSEPVTLTVTGFGAGSSQAMLRGATCVCMTGCCSSRPCPPHRCCPGMSVTCRLVQVSISCRACGLCFAAIRMGPPASKQKGSLRPQAVALRAVVFTICKDREHPAHWPRPSLDRCADYPEEWGVRMYLGEQDGARLGATTTTRVSLNLRADCAWHPRCHATEHQNCWCCGGSTRCRPESVRSGQYSRAPQRQGSLCDPAPLISRPIELHLAGAAQTIHARDGASAVR